MKIFIPLTCILSLALAEPPVGDSYPSARSSHDYNHEHDHRNDFQRSLSQEYGPPAARSFDAPHNDLSREYLPPNARTANMRSSLSQTYGPPSGRSDISQEYSVPDAKSLEQYSPSSRDPSTQYRTRSGPSETYNAPAARSGLSQEYGVPSVGSDANPSAQYGEPELRTPSEEYGVPSQRSFDTPSKKYDAPAALNSPSARSGSQHRHTAPKSFAKSFASGASRSLKGSAQFGARSPSTSYGAPAARSSYSYSQDAKALSQGYAAPSQHDMSDTIEVPSARALSQEYGVPAGRAANQKTSAVASTYTAASRSPSNTYGAPLARGGMPSEQYGVPDQYSNVSNEGYSYARDGLNEEPANYDFSYRVDDYESGSDFGHAETRQDNRAEGSYFVVLPDGTKQVVEYEADERGFKPRISVEPVDLGRSGGYDDNTAELARSNDGPY